MKKDMKEKISIIIPIFNAEAYLTTCLDSVLEQTYSNFEVICVNDGSTDRTGEICDKFRERDNRVKVYHIENQGVGHARNFGLSVMKGTWFCFVDSDDWIEPNYLERMYDLAQEKKCDLVACGVDMTYKYVKGLDGKEENIYIFETSKVCVENFICNKNSMHGVSWNKLYNAKKFKDVLFDEYVKVNEDCLYVFRIMSLCERACLTTLPLYHWYIRQDSACHRRAGNADFGAANVFLKLYKEIENEEMDEARLILKKNYVVSVVQVLLYAKYAKGESGVMDARKRCKEWKRDVWRLLETRQKMKYLYAINFRSRFGKNSAIDGQKQD